MKKFKIILLVIISLAVIASPFAFVFASAVTSPPCYQNTFVGALDDKLERLNSIEGEKLVLIGGSSLAFGIDSALIEKYTGRPTVNFGLYASLGTKLMLDLSKSSIGKGDVVIIAPELDAQTLSLYFNSETTLQAFDGNFSMLRHIESENIFPLLSGMWNFAVNKAKLQEEGIPDPEGVYNSKNFNEYGDLTYPRTENIMLGYRDSNVMIDPSPEILSDDFCDYINEYTRFCERRGAKVYYSFSPMNQLGFKNGYDASVLDDFSAYLDSKTDAPIISSINNYVYEAGYFYDTNFHLNDSGVRVHTVNLIKDILLELGIPKYVDEDIPQAPALPFFDAAWQGSEENSEFFTYERTENGSYRITGLSEAGKAEKILTLPLGYNGYIVTSVGKEAFSGSLLEKLIIPKDGNIKNLEDSSFAGAGNLSELWIYYPYEEKINPPTDFVGTAEDFTVHIPTDSYYDTGYYWSERGLTFIKDAN